MTSCSVSSTTTPTPAVTWPRDVGTTYAQCLSDLGTAPCLPDGGTPPDGGLPSCDNAIVFVQ